MLTWKEFLLVAYELTEDEFEGLGIYKKRTIELEYEAWNRAYLN